MKAVDRAPRPAGSRPPTLAAPGGRRPHPK